jgi:hypothetical protein
MRVNSRRRFLLRTIQTLTIFLTLTTVQSVRSQTTNPPKTPDVKGAPAGNQSAGQTGTGQTPSGQTQTGQTPSGQTQTGQTQTGQTQTGQTPTGQTAKGETPTVTKPAGTPAALCRSPEQEHDYRMAQFELKQMMGDIAMLRDSIRNMQETARDLTNKIAHYDKVINGKEELFDEEKADHIVPAAAKVDTKTDLDAQNREIDDEKKKLEAKMAEAYPLTEKIAAFEKLAPCPKSPDTATPQTPGTKPIPGTPAKPAVAGGCANSTDAEKLEEYRSVIARLERENGFIGEQLTGLDKEIDDTQGNKELGADLKQGRLEQFKLRKTSLEDTKARNQITIDDFKLRVKAILEKKPCPPEEKKISKPETPGTGTPTRRTDKGRKDDDRKMTKKNTSTGKTVRRAPSDGTTSDDARRSDDISRAISTGIDIGIDIGLSRGGERFNDRGGRSREMSPRVMPRD